MMNDHQYINLIIHTTIHVHMIYPSISRHHILAANKVIKTTTNQHEISNNEQHITMTSTEQIKTPICSSDINIVHEIVETTYDHHLTSSIMHQPIHLYDNNNQVNTTHIIRYASNYYGSKPWIHQTINLIRKTLN